MVWLDFFFRFIVFIFDVRFVRGFLDVEELFGTLFVREYLVVYENVGLGCLEFKFCFSFRILAGYVFI